MTNISVLLPVSADTSPQHFRDSVDSISSQTTSPDELILATNQELPPELEEQMDRVIRSTLGCERVHRPNIHGLGEILQEGLEICSGEFVARMDADDIAIPSRFEKQKACLTETDVQIIGSHLGEFTQNPDQVERVRRVPLTHDEIVDWIAWRCPMNHPTVMFEREAVMAIGGYQRFPMMEDWHLWARGVSSGLRFGNLDHVLVKARVCDLSDRRGGMEYVRSEVRMAEHLRRLGLASRTDTLRHISLRIPPRLLPSKVRSAIYSQLARR